MKQIFLLLTMLLITTISANAQYGQSNATLTINNKSEYTLTVKVMRTYGGLYSSVVISPKSSRTISFSRSGSFYCKTKAEKWSETLYKRSGTFSVQCDDIGYTQTSLDFCVSSSGYGSSGSSISKSEFEKNE